MNSKLKVISLLIITLAATGALLYIPLTEAFQSGETQSSESENLDKDHLIWWMLNNSESVEIEGTATAFHKDMLLINTADDQARIVLAEEWTVGTDVVLREMLFGSGYLSVGENVTVKALRTNIIEKESMNIYFLIGYEVIDELGVHAYAAMPINIET